jgi:hypothetical protein
MALLQALLRRVMAGIPGRSVSVLQDDAALADRRR